MRKTSIWALVTVAVVASVLGAACGDDSAAECNDGADACGEIDCATATIPTFTQVPFAANCQTCHSNNADTRKAQGVPDDSDYSTYAGVSTRVKEIAIRVNDTCTPMPPNGSPALADADKQAFTIWGCCGGPQ